MTSRWCASGSSSSFRARSSMILEARNSSRRCTTVTAVAKRVRKVASSIAESPPPTTAMSWSRKKKPSQVAQALHAAAEQRLLAGNVQVAGRGAHREDHRRAR